VAAAAALSATVLVGAAPPSGSRLVEVARVGPAAVVATLIAGSMLFAATLDRGPQVVAYRLADGAQQWAAPLAGIEAEAQVGRLDVVDGVVLVGMSGGPAAVQTVAVDAANGRELWRSDFQVVPPADQLLIWRYRR
jgi:outer membrane protein assembly factor BamB